MRSLRANNRSLTALLALAGAMACAGGGYGGGGPELTPAPEPAAAPAAPVQPDAESIYESMIAAMGGRAALQAYHSSRATGTFSMPAMGMEGSLEVSGAAPNKIFISVDIPGIGVVTQGYDGEVGWSDNPMMGPMVLEGNELHQMRQQADFYGVLNRAQYVTSAEIVEVTDFEGRPCHKIRVVTTWDEEYFEFVDVETHLAAGSIRNQESPMGPVEATSVVSGYRDFGGILTPTTMVQRVMGQEQVLTITSVEYDTVDDSVFELPDSIKRLVGR